MNKIPIIGVMGGGSADDESAASAYRLGALIAEQGWILLNGGRAAGIMEASAKGAYDREGITVGILPDDHSRKTSAYIKIPILTGMGMARNAINVLSSDVVVACPGGTGTISEIALALKSHKPVVLFNFNMKSLFEAIPASEKMYYAASPEEVIDIIKTIIDDNQPNNC